MSDAGSNAGLDETAIARKQKQAEDLARAKEAGWSNPIPFKYDTVVGGEPVPDETRDSAPWLSDAAVYQWDDEFGDVGERNPELEKMLFEDTNLQRAGQHIKALSFHVNIEGPEKVQPVRNVSPHNQHRRSSLLISIVRGCRSSPCHGRQC
jgi:ATP-dependent RNA helicase DDX3X